MTSPAIEIRETRAQELSVSEDALTVELAGGRTISVPLAWYPRLLHATASERANWRFTADRTGVHWTDLDEDVSVESLLAGKPSGESQASLKKWLAARS